MASENAEAVNKETAALIANSVAVVPEAIHAAEQVVTKTTLVTTTTTKTVKKGAEQVDKQHTVEKQSKTSSTRSAATREASQNESNLLLEQNAKLKTSTPRANKAAPVNDSSFTNGSTNTTAIMAVPGLEDHAAFKEYKDAGEYWNKFPKTDYTYSKLSQHRREIKPGVIAMPNMSRRSLEHHSERVAAMIRRDPAQESFFRSRYEALTALRKRSAVDSYYDSQDETDLSFGINTSRTTRSFFRRVVTTITSFFSAIFYFFTPSNKRNTSAYYVHYGEQQGTRLLWPDTFSLCRARPLEIDLDILSPIGPLCVFRRLFQAALVAVLQRRCGHFPSHLHHHLGHSVLGHMGIEVVGRVGPQKEDLLVVVAAVVARSPARR